VSSYRPAAPIFAVTTDGVTSRQLAPVWGVRPILYQRGEVSYEALTAFGKRAVLEHGAGRSGDSVVVSAGVPFHTSGTTNTMRVEQL